MIDARGLSCPQPVIAVRKEIRANAPESLEVLVDSACAVENITRFAHSNGYAAEVAPQDGQAHLLRLTKR